MPIKSTANTTCCTPSETPIRPPNLISLVPVSHDPHRSTHHSAHLNWSGRLVAGTRKGSLLRAQLNHRAYPDRGCEKGSTFCFATSCLLWLSMNAGCFLFQIPKAKGIMHAWLAWENLFDVLDQLMWCGIMYFLRSKLVIPKILESQIFSNLTKFV